MRKIIFALVFMLCTVPGQVAAQAVPSFILDIMPGARPVGAGRMSYMMFDLYDATLYAPQGEWAPGQQMALSLVYLRHLNGQQIADRSVQEIRGQGFTDEIKLAEWHEQMSAIFPDVDEHTSLTGVLDKDGETAFFLNNQKIGQINDTEFGIHFFNIWLGPRTSDPELYAELLGVKP